MNFPPHLSDWVFDQASIAIDQLHDARLLIATPDKWVQGVWGIGTDGERFGDAHSAQNRRCKCLCLEAALVTAGAKNARCLSWHLCAAVIGDSALWSYNDARETTHADVLHVIDQAIDKARALIPPATALRPDGQG